MINTVFTWIAAMLEWLYHISGGRLGTYEEPTMGVEYSLTLGPFYTGSNVQYDYEWIEIRLYLFYLSYQGHIGDEYTLFINSPIARRLTKHMQHLKWLVYTCYRHSIRSGYGIRTFLMYWREMRKEVWP